MTIPTVRLPDGTDVPALGQGTWKMGEAASRAADEIAALQAGIERGMTLIDTAEMYAAGGAEQIVAAVLRGQRPKLFLVSKVSPQNASRTGTVAACEASLRRLQTDVIDLYLLHWPGRHPLGDTVDAFERLRAAGKIRYWGVSNFDTGQMGQVAALPGGGNCATNQILYNPANRGPEFDLLPWCAARGMPVMAYSPLGQAGALLRSAALAAVGRRHGKTAAQVAIAWSLRDGRTISIPKSASIERVAENAAAAEIVLTAADLAEIDAAHKPPKTRQPLGML